MSSGSQSVAAKTSPATTTSRLPAIEHPASAEPVGAGRQPQRDERVAEQRQGQDDADRQRVEADRGEVQDEDDGEEPVPEHPQDPQGEQPAAVASRGHAGWRRDRRRQDRPRWSSPRPESTSRTAARPGCVGRPGAKRPGSPLPMERCPGPSPGIAPPGDAMLGSARRQEDAVDDVDGRVGGLDVAADDGGLAVHREVLTAAGDLEVGALERRVGAGQLLRRQPARDHVVGQDRRQETRRIGQCRVQGRLVRSPRTRRRSGRRR